MVIQYVYVYIYMYPRAYHFRLFLHCILSLHFAGPTFYFALLFPSELTGVP